MNPVFRILYLFYRLFSSARHRALRRITGPGRAVVVGTLVAAMMGIDPDNTVGYQAFTLLFALLVVGTAFTLYFRVRFSATRLLPRFGTVGQPFSYRVAIRNLTPKHQTGLTLLESLADPRPSFREWKALQLDNEKHLRPFRLSQRRRTGPFQLATVKEAVIPSIPAHQEVQAEVQLTPTRRGILQFDALSLARTDPFGLFRTFVKKPLRQTVLILPKRYWLPPVALPGVLKYQQGGVTLASNVGQSDEFVALREYRRGDPIRHIHWRSWAKAGKPIVKEFEDEFFVRHALVLDTFTERVQSDEFEEAVSVAASFACTVLTQESLLDLLFVGPEAYCFTAGRGLAQADHMLEILAAVRPCPDRPFGSLETLVLNHASALSGCICVLLAWDEERRDLVRKLKALGLPVLVLVIFQQAPAQRLDPGPMRDDPNHLHALEIGRIEEQLAVLT
jgi:uncharacterized protein (DUF58 family)